MLEKHLNFAKYHASSFHKANEIEISVVEELRGLLANIFSHNFKHELFGG